MLQHILVPLDGSTLSEQVLPVAARIARSSGGTLVLFHASGAGYEYGPYLMRAGMESAHIVDEELVNARQYLEHISRIPALAGIEIQTVAVIGVAADAILSYASSLNFDLIVMGSHGYSGVKRWLLGSVAAQVVRNSTVPVFVIRGEHSFAQAEPGALRMLVALDGSPFAEAILEPALYLIAALAAPGQGTLHLTQLIQLPTIEEEILYRQRGIDISVRTDAIAAAGRYLQAITDKLRQGYAAQLSVNVLWTTEECQDVADMLISVAEHGDALHKNQSCDALALTTHGRNFLLRWALGSVVDRILHGTPLSLFIVHPTQVPEHAYMTEGKHEKKR